MIFEKIGPQHLERKAILYVRQSSVHQVLHNRESSALQYAMRDRLTALGWSHIETVDDDLGRSAAGGVTRAGFDRMVAEVCLGKVGAVAARKVSRFARNSRDWQQLIEMCRVVDTVLIDQETVYAPRQGNDRLLLGLKGSLNEYELDLLRQRSRSARYEKARRGELVVAAPVGFVKAAPLIQVPISRYLTVFCRSACKNAGVANRCPGAAKTARCRRAPRVRQRLVVTHSLRRMLVVNKSLLVACGVAISLTCPVRAQEAAPHQHQASEQLGKVDFAVSCAAQAKPYFNLAVAWLHSFEYEEAERSFLRSAEADPHCAMSYWGVAMSQYHPLWAPPTRSELEKGQRAIERAGAIGGRSPRERAFIAALAVFYANADRTGHRERTFAYADAMERLYRLDPSDREAAVFYALSLVAAGMIDDDESFTREKKAAAILNTVLAVQPDHPGVAHYLIHSYDYPPLAHLALPAARRYAGIAPASAHAQHMPSHIFVRLGLWEDAVRANLGAEASAQAYARRHELPGSWDERLHAMDYLAYAYLQMAQDSKANRVLDELNAIQQVDPVNFKVAYAFSAIPARLVLERRQWNQAADLTLSPNALRAVPWSQFRWAEAHVHFARAIGAARSRDLELARSEIAVLDTIRQALAGSGSNYDWGLQVQIEREIAVAWVEAADGRREEALRRMRSVADLDDATEKHPVTPGSLLPAREQLAELLLELHRPVEAMAEFERSLSRAPNRFTGLYGAARAAREAGDVKRAAVFFTALLDVSCNGDGARPELDEARTFVASNAKRPCASRPSARVQ